MIDPTELIEIITVGVVKIVGWGEYNGGGGRPWKVYVQESLRSSCRRRIKVSDA